jgi:hypothetical protein
MVFSICSAAEDIQIMLEETQRKFEEERYFTACEFVFIQLSMILIGV